MAANEQRKWQQKKEPVNKTVGQVI